MISNRFQYRICVFVFLTSLLTCVNVVQAYNNGTGGPSDPYQLAEAADLEQLASTPTDWAASFVITADIDMERVVLNPIGNLAMPFTGTFNGMGHSIGNLLIYDTDTESGGTGLFGLVDTAGVAITSVILENPTIIANTQDDVGALAGRLANGIIRNCGVVGGRVFGTISSDNHVGGLIGANGAGTVIECYATALVEGTYITGGLIGHNESGGLIQDCYTTGCVVIRPPCLSPGGQDFLVGGLVGLNNGSVLFCYADGSIHPLVGSDTCTGCIGSLFGGMALTSYPSPFVFSCFSDADIAVSTVGCGELPAGSVSAVTEADLANEKTFNAWDFDLTWYMRSGPPRLQWQNLKPVADPNGDISVTLLSTDQVVTVNFDGLASYDPDGDPLSYCWTWSRNGDMYCTNGGKVDVAFPAGHYDVTLVVNDGIVDSDPNLFNVDINTQPIAKATTPSSVISLSSADSTSTGVSVDGSNSTDADGHTLSYAWDCYEIRNGQRQSPPVATSTLSTDTFQLEAGWYEIELIVNDGKVSSTPDVVKVRVNTPPTAKMRIPSGIIRPDEIIDIKSDDSFDPDGDPLTYEWTVYKMIDGRRQNPPVETSINPSETLRLQAGVYEVELVVSDGIVRSAPDTKSITVNTAPIAKACDNIEVFDDGTGQQSVELTDGGSCDADGDELSYTWTCPTATPQTATGPSPIMIFPVGVDQPVNLTVDDGFESHTDSMQVTVTEALSASRTAVSPQTVGRKSKIEEVKFYILLPAGTRTRDVNTSEPIYLRINNTESACTRDTAYDHKQRTVVVDINREDLLAQSGEDGSKTATLVLRLTSGQAVSSTIHFDVTSGYGPNLSAIMFERLGYYLSPDWE